MRGPRSTKGWMKLRAGSTRRPGAAHPGIARCPRASSARARKAPISIRHRVDGALGDLVMGVEEAQRPRGRRHRLGPGGCEPSRCAGPAARSAAVGRWRCESLRPAGGVLQVALHELKSRPQERVSSVRTRCRSRRTRSGAPSSHASRPSSSHQHQASPIMPLRAASE